MVQIYMRLVVFFTTSEQTYFQDLSIFMAFTKCKMIGMMLNVAKKKCLMFCIFSIKKFRFLRQQLVIITMRLLQ